MAPKIGHPGRNIHPVPSCLPDKLGSIRDQEAVEIELLFNRDRRQAQKKYGKDAEDKGKQEYYLENDSIKNGDYREYYPNGRIFRHMTDHLDTIVGIEYSLDMAYKRRKRNKKGSPNARQKRVCGA